MMMVQLSEMKCCLMMMVKLSKMKLSEISFFRLPAADECVIV